MGYWLDNHYYDTLADVANTYNIPYGTLYKRLRKGRTIEESVHFKPKERTYPKEMGYSIDGVFYPTLSHVARAFDIPEQTLHRRMQRGRSIEDAVFFERKDMKDIPKGEGHWLDGVYFPTLAHVARTYDIPEHTLYKRLQNGRSLEDAVYFKRKNTGNRSVQFNGETYESLTELAAYVGLSNTTHIARLIDKGYTPEIAAWIAAKEQPCRQIVYYKGELYVNKDEMCKAYGTSQRIIAEKAQVLGIRFTEALDRWLENQHHAD